MPNYPQSDRIRQLFRQGQLLTYGKGNIILGNEETANGVYYISTGYVKIYSISDSGSQLRHIIYGPCELFPLVWAYLGAERDLVFYEALSECTLWRISRAWFLRWVKSDSALCYAVSMQLAQQFRFYSDRVDNLEYKKASDRVAYRLLYLASRFGVKTKDGTTIQPILTHDVLASSINLARESFSREIEKLEKSNVIQSINHQIVIPDIETLAKRITRPSSFDA